MGSVNSSGSCLVINRSICEFPSKSPGITLVMRYSLESFLLIRVMRLKDLLLSPERSTSTCLPGKSTVVHPFLLCSVTSFHQVSWGGNNLDKINIKLSLTWMSLFKLWHTATSPSLMGCFLVQPHYDYDSLWGVNLHAGSAKEGIKNNSRLQCVLSLNMY